MGRARPWPRVRQARERGEPAAQKERVMGVRRKAGAWHKAGSARRLPDKQIIAEAVKIIGKADSAWYVAYYLDWLNAFGTPTKVHYFSKEAARSDQRVLAWLRRGKVLLKNAYSTQFLAAYLDGSAPPSFESFRSE